MRMYRYIEDKTYGGFTIQRRRSFLWWSWWSNEMIAYSENDAIWYVTLKNNTTGHVPRMENPPPPPKIKTNKMFAVNMSDGFLPDSVISVFDNYVSAKKYADDIISFYQSVSDLRPPKVNAFYKRKSVYLYERNDDNEDYLHWYSRRLAASDFKNAYITEIELNDKSFIDRLKKGYK